MRWKEMKNERVTYSLNNLTKFKKEFNENNTQIIEKLKLIEQEYINMPDVLSTPKSNQIIPKLTELVKKDIDVVMSQGEYFNNVLTVAIEQYNNFVHYENEMSGIPEFRVAIASFLYKYFNIDANPSQIIVGSDPMQLLANLLTLPSICNSTPKTEKIGLLKLAEEVSQKNFPYIQRIAAVEETASQGIRNIIAKAGIKLSEVPIGNKDFMFKSLLTTGANLAIINSDNSVLRGGIEEKPYLDFLEWSYKEKYRYIIEYDSLTVNTSSLPLKQFDKKDKVIYLRSFKSFTPLSSASFLILPKELADEYKLAFKDFNCPLSYLEQTVLIDFIISGKLYSYLEKIKNL